MQLTHQCLLFSNVGIKIVVTIETESCTGYSRLREVCATCHLHGAEVRVHRVAVSRTIQVYNIGDMSEDLLSLYFENKRSGGSEVTHVRVCQEDDYALVEVTDNASELQHLYSNALDGGTVDVSPAVLISSCLHSHSRSFQPLPSDISSAKKQRL